MNYTVQYFIDKFEAIPVLGRGSVTLGCAYGQCGGYSTEESMGLTNIFRILNDNAVSMVIIINDGTHPSYRQPTPKQRILAALYDIRAMQSKQPAYENISKSLAVLPVNETSDVINQPLPASAGE